MRIVRRLAPFKRQRINFLAFDGDPEIVGLATDVLATLQGPDSAGWIVSVSYGREFGLNVFGLGIEVQQDADETRKQAAAARVDALTQVGLPVQSVPPLAPRSSRGGTGKFKRDPAAKIKLTIGIKP